MASKTKKLEFIRTRKRKAAGSKRKAAIKSKGSTKSKKELFGD